MLILKSDVLVLLQLHMLVYPTKQSSHCTKELGMSVQTVTELDVLTLFQSISH